MPGSTEQIIESPEITTDSPAAPEPTLVGLVYELSASGSDIGNYNQAVAINPQLREFFTALVELNKNDAVKKLDEFECLKKMFASFILLYSTYKGALATKADEAALTLFTTYMVNLNEASKNQQGVALINASQTLLTITLNDLDKETKQAKKPLHPAISAMIGGIIGAVVGGILFATLGAACSFFLGGVAAIPAFFVGLVKGFMVGSTTAMIGVGTAGFASLMFAGTFGVTNAIDRRDVDVANKQRTLLHGVQNSVDNLKLIADKGNFVGRMTAK